METVLDDIDTITTDLLAVDLDTLSDAELHRLVVGLQRQRDRFAVAASRLTAAWDRRRIWATDGSRSAAHRLAREGHCSLRTAKNELCRARRTTRAPLAFVAAASGEISADHLDLLGRANTPARAALFAEHESVLVDQCTGLRFFADAARVVEYWCQFADALLHDGAEPPDVNELYVSATFDKTVAITGVLDAVNGEIVTNELTRLEREVYLADKRDGVSRTPAQRRAAALVEMSIRSATMPAGGQRPRPLFTALVGDASLARLCELAGGTVITPERLRPWIDAAVLETVLFDGPTTVVSVSRRRLFTGVLRRAIEVRDRHCQHPSGCDVPADRCDVDHIVPAGIGGVTSQFDGRIQCPTHNRDAKHHDHGAVPLPERPLTRLDELRVRVRWRLRRYYPDEIDDTDPFADQPTARAV